MNTIDLTYICNDTGIPISENSGSSIHIQEFLRGISETGVNTRILYQNPGEKLNKIEYFDYSDHIAMFPYKNNKLLMMLNISNIIANYELKEKLAKSKFSHNSLIHERYSLFSSGAAEYASDNDIPYILEVNSPLIYEGEKFSKIFGFKNTASRLEQRIFDKSDHICTVSIELKEHFSKYTSSDNITVIPNGANPNMFSPDTEPAICCEEFTIGFVGSFKKWHGIDRIINICKKIKEKIQDFRFLLVGDGPMYSKIKSEIKQNNLKKHITLTEKVEHSNVPKYLAAMDVAIAPYPDLDFFYYSPVKIFEYMAMALPTIASDIGQVGRVIEDKKDGYLIDPSNNNQFAAKIIDLYMQYESDSNHFQKIGKSARTKIKNEYSWKNNAERYRDIYSRFINN
jgi:glycosyltransferase involved in cell wall biosynthesis